VSVRRWLVGIGLAMFVGISGAMPVAAQITAEVKRPVPGPVVPPPSFRNAIEGRTRDEDGSPGKKYWQNHSEYRIEASLDPETGTLTGSAVIEYQNEAPGDLRLLGLHLYQNLHVAGVVRNRPQEITGGVVISRVVVEGEKLGLANLQQSPGYVVDGTALWIRPVSPLAENHAVTIEIDWSVVLPQSGSGRMGYSDREVYLVAYWFPKMAVLDDLNGWDIEPYQGNAEFYDEYGDYDVSITVPGGWTVMATGDLENEEEVLSGQTRERLAVAAVADTVVRIASRRELGAGTVTAGGDSLTYRFAAKDVRDFTFTTSNVQNWDATSALVPDRDGDGNDDRVLINSFWRDYRAPLWTHQVLYGKHSIEHHSRYTGFSYPWPHMTSVEGADIIGGGMEFPMLTLIGDYNGRSAEDLYNVTAHEIAHMWIPMIVGTNEKRYAWMDEGSTTFLENHARPDYWPGAQADSIELLNYAAVARAEAEQPLMRHGDYYEPGPGYGTASYAKPATLLVTLRNMLGEDVFLTGYQTFIREWAFKHPTPWDLFNTFERVAGTDLDWFWSSWYYETWSLDFAVREVRNGKGDGASVVVIEDRGFAPMPVTVEIRTERGSVLREVIPVSAWLTGENEFEITVAPEQGDVVGVTIDPEGSLPDIDHGNNRWSGGK
jgi:Peptidase family M1 domain